VNFDRTLERVLIYRLGSLGDTLLALPALHLIRQQFPHADLTLLTHIPTASKAAPLTSILEHTNLYQRVISYPLHLRSVAQLNQLRRHIASQRFQLAVHLAEFRGTLKSIRDYLFFRACGITRILGLSWGRLGTSQSFPEWEAHRLAHRLAPLGKINLTDPTSWDLRLTCHEIETAEKLLIPINRPFIAASLGTKVEVNHWTEPNWSALLSQIRRKWPDLGLVFVGAIDEVESCERCSKDWLGQKLNLCGQISPRISAAILQKARLFIGHDSGPLHLAATIGTRCVGIYSGRHQPGQWFPRGNENLIIYHRTPCSGCGLNSCANYQKKCILSISVEEVLGAIGTQLSRNSVSIDSRPFANVLFSDI
jgi:ADP-heptose:LPS heptosyltransferase